jgi:drug/metabolite transporter (DMT)-like permease
MGFVAQRLGMEFIGPFLFMGIRMLFGALTLLVVLFGSDLLASLRAKRGEAAEAEAEAEQEAAISLEQMADAEGERATEPKGECTQDSEAPARGATKPQRYGLTWPRLLKAGIACGLAIFLAGSFQQVALVFTTASKAGFLTALYIVLVPILGIALRQKARWNTWISVLIAAVGLYFLCVTGDFSIQLGDMLALIGALFWACHILVIDYFVKGLRRRDVVRLCIVQFVFASVVALVLAPFFDGMFVSAAFNLDALIAALPTILYAGILSTGVAFTLQAIGQQGLSPSAASIIMSLEAVFSVLGGMLILGELLSAREFFGCVAMFAAVVLSQLPVSRLKRGRNNPS